MSRHFLVRLMTLTAVVAMMTMVPPGLASEDTALPPETQTQVANTLQSAPIMFIENVGQFDDSARFRVYGGGHDLWLAEDALWITVLEPSPAPDAEHLLLLGEEAGPGGDESQPHWGVALRLSFVDANPHFTIKSFSRLDTHVSYFIGNDPAQWHTDAPVWGGVRYVDLYPGVDLELTSESGQYIQRLVAHDGADLSAVRLRVEGAEAVKLDGDRLCLTTTVGEYTLPLFQVTGAALSDLPSPAITSNQIVSPFAESAIPTPQSAIVNLQSNVLLYATFLGGSDRDYGEAIAMDSGGAAYVTGTTCSVDFPTTPGAFDTTFNGGDYDAFVAKLAVGGEPDNFTDLGNAEDEAQHNLVGWGAAQGPPDNPLVSPSGDRTKRYQALRGDNSLDLLVDTVNVSYLLTAEVEDGWCTDNFEIYINGEGPLYQYEGLNAGTGPTNAMVHRVLVLAEYITQPKVTVTFRNTSTDNCGLAAVYNVGLFPLDGFFYSVTGHIRDGSDNPIPSVIVSTGAGGFATTDASGAYTIAGLDAGTYTLTPSKSGWTFTPATRTVSVPPDATGQDFTGYDRPPIVLVHGFQGLGVPRNCGDYDPNNTFQQVDDFLSAAGYYTVFAYLETSPCYTPPLRKNVPNLKEAIEQAKTDTGQDKVILISHSMGGLVSRAYIENRAIYEDDVAALFTFGSPHWGIPEDLQAFFANGLSLGEYCRDFQPAVCDFSVLGMISFNRDYKKQPDVVYHLISGDAPNSSRNLPGMITGAIIPGADDAIVPTSSGIGQAGIIDRLITDEVHGTGSGKRSYFIRDGGPSTSYMQCLKPVLVTKTTDTCGNGGLLQVTAEATPTLTARTSFEYGTLLAGQSVTRTISLEGGPTLFAAHWQTGTLAVTLVDPNDQTIDPAYAGSHPDVVTYDADETAATYYFTDTIAGAWQLALQATSVPIDGSAFTTFAAFESDLALTAGTDRLWYTPGATATITASLTGSPASATVTATILLADGVTDTVTLSPQGSNQYQATYTVPDAPGYAEVRLVATGATAGSAPFERGRNLLFQISPNSVALTGAYSDTPQPRSPGSSFYKALSVTVSINAVVSGTVGLSADLVDATGNFVAHSLTIKDVITGTGTLTLRFDGDDIYASRRDGPYTLTSLLLTDRRAATLVVAEAEDVYTTAAYGYPSFGTGEIYLPLVMHNSP